VPYVSQHNIIKLEAVETNPHSVDVTVTVQEAEDALFIEFAALANSAIGNCDEGCSDFVWGEFGHLVHY
jgi:hypothetical protein